MLTARAAATLLTYLTEMNKAGQGGKWGLSNPTHVDRQLSNRVR